MEEKELVEKLNKYNPNPSKEWQERTLEHLNTVVTNSENNRNSNMNLFNLLNSITMNTKFKGIVTIATIATTLAIATGAVYASDPAKPGDFLYPVDKVAEQIRRTLTLDALNRAEFEMDVMDERVLELRNLSEGSNANQISNSISEVEAQKERLRVMLEEMTQLRARNKVQAEEQLQVMNKLASKIQSQEQVMNQVQTNLDESGDASNSGELDQVQNQYSEEMQNQIKNFEDNTGLKVNTNTQESEQNQGEDTQIQNQNQNQVSTGDENGGVQGVQNQNGSSGSNR